MNKNIQQRSTSINALFFIKGIACFFVVCCHTTFLGDYKDYILSPLQNSAVPIFFMISGYFLNLSSEKKENIIRTIKKIAKILCAIIAVYSIVMYPNNGLIIDSFPKLIQTIIFGNTLSGHLWYLSAYLVSIIILYFTALLGDKYIVLFIPLLIVGLITSTYNSLLGLNIPYITPYNFYFTGLPYISIGYLFKKYKLQKYLNNNWIYLILIFCILCYIEIAVLIYNSISFCNIGYYIMTMPLAVSFFGWGISTSYQGNKIINEIGIKSSGNIYYFHVLVWTALQKIFILLPINFYPKIFGAIYTFLASIILSIAINWIQNRIKINIFK